MNMNIFRSCMNKFAALVLLSFSSSIGFGFAATPFPPSTSNQKLTKDVIDDLYEGFLKGYKKSEHVPFAYDQVSWKEGAFTQKGVQEAVVLITDYSSFPHSEGYAHLFLLQNQGRWKIIRDKALGDSALLRTMDLEGDGRSEVWIESSGGNQGYTEMVGSLLSFTPDGEVTLYSNRGHDYTGSGILEGEVVRKHEVSFRDVDRDGVLELIDKEMVVDYKGSKEPAVRTVTKTFKLRNGKFEKYER